VLRAPCGCFVRRASCAVRRAPCGYRVPRALCFVRGGSEDPPYTCRTAPSNEARSTRHEARGTRHVARSTRHEARGTRHVARGTKHMAPSTWHPAPARRTAHEAPSTNDDLFPFDGARRLRRQVQHQA
jgi:hypothetical protein